MGSSQQVSELKPVDLGAVGSLAGCGVRMEWAGKQPDFQVRAAPGWDRLAFFPGPSLLLSGCFLGGRRVSVVPARGLGLRNDVMLQQLDSISLRRRETANFLDFANLADLTLAESEVFRLHSKKHHFTFI